METANRFSEDQDKGYSVRGCIVPGLARESWIQKSHCVCRTVSLASNKDESFLTGDRDWPRGVRKEVVKDNEMEKQRRRPHNYAILPPL